MWFHLYLWLLLCYAQNGLGSILEDYEKITQDMLSPPQDDFSLALPIEIERDKDSGCMCKATKNRKLIICFGNYECRKFPKLKRKSETLMVRTTVIEEVHASQVDSLYHLKILKLEANHKLHYIQPEAFRNLTNLQKLTISYCTSLLTIPERLFEGLVNLKDLILIDNGFTNIVQLTPAFKSYILPALKTLNLAENYFEIIPQNAFDVMSGTTLENLNINLCRLDFIHPNSFDPLKRLKVLNIGQNDVNSSIIGEFLINIKNNEINITELDLSGLGFRKQPPMKLLQIIANTTVKKLILSDNQFEVIYDDSFPEMPNVEMIDLRRVSALSIGSKVFDPTKFPKLRILLLGGNNLPGIHLNNVSDEQLILLDLSCNKGPPASPMFYEIYKGVFEDSKELRVLNLAYNRIKSIFDYTFKGLNKLKVLNLENATIHFIGVGTFRSIRHLDILNLANNPLTSNVNLSSGMFSGLNELKVLILKSCNIKHIYDDDNIFEMMPNLTHLVLSNNQLYYITDETLKPLKFLKLLDLSGNLMVSWWKPLFLSSGIHPTNIYLTNNKITQFTVSMLQDLNFLLNNRTNTTVEIDLMDNIFVCDCNSLYKAYLWLQVNGSNSLKQYFDQSNFLCSSPDIFEDRRVAEYLSSIKRLQCIMYERISSFMYLIWTAPSIISLIIFSVIIISLYKYRIYIKYWFFLARIAIGRSVRKKSSKANNMQGLRYKYDAFVSYSNEDKEFVSEMIAQLECTTPYLKLCVYERDFEIGAFISESILASINESKYILLVISQHFAKSQWCRWETQLAEYHRLFLEDGTSYDPLILIRLGDVENKYLTTTLKYLLQTKIYLLWDERQPEEFWKKLRNVLIKNN